MKKTLSIILIVLVVVTAALCLFGCKNTTYKYPDAKKYHVGPGVYDVSSVNALNVAWDEGALNVICSDEYSSVSVSEENNVTDERFVLHQYLDSDGTLWVKPFASKIKSEDIPSFRNLVYLHF